jgi:hypothetical protein
MVFGLDSDLQLLIFVKDTLRVVDQSLEPLWPESKMLAVRL